MIHSSIHSFASGLGSDLGLGSGVFSSYKINQSINPIRLFPSFLLSFFPSFLLSYELSELIPRRSPTEKKKARWKGSFASGKNSLMVSLLLLLRGFYSLLVPPGDLSIHPIYLLITRNEKECSKGRRNKKEKKKKKRNKNHCTRNQN